jgi:hypothetical protein
LTVPSDEKTVREIERALGTQLERRRLPDFDYGAFVPERQPASYSAIPERGKHNARSLRRPDGNSGGNGGYASHAPRPANRSTGNRNHGSGGNSGNGNTRRRWGERGGSR